MRDRLVVCPECDDLIVEDEWLEHKADCYPYLHKMSTDDFIREIARRERDDPSWEDSIYLREEGIKSACEAYKDWWGRGLYHVPIMRGLLATHSWISENAAKPPAIDSFTKIVVQIPPELGPLPERVAFAIIREQIEQQWKEFSDV